MPTCPVLILIPIFFGQFRSSVFIIPSIPTRMGMDFSLFVCLFYLLSIFLYWLEQEISMMIHILSSLPAYNVCISVQYFMITLDIKTKFGVCHLQCYLQAINSISSLLVDSSSQIKTGSHISLWDIFRASNLRYWYQSHLHSYLINNSLTFSLMSILHLLLVNY